MTHTPARYHAHARALINPCTTSKCALTMCVSAHVYMHAYVHTYVRAASRMQIRVVTAVHADCDVAVKHVTRM